MATQTIDFSGISDGDKLGTVLGFGAKFGGDSTLSISNERVRVDYSASAGWTGYEFTGFEFTQDPNIKAILRLTNDRVSPSLIINHNVDGSCYFIRLGNAYVELWERTAGGQFTEIVTAVDFTVPPHSVPAISSTGTEVHLYRVGVFVKVKVGGAEVVSHNPASDFTGGNAGIGSYYAVAGSDINLDDITVFDGVVMGNVLAPYSFNLQGGYPQGTIPETHGTVPFVVPSGWQLPTTNYVPEQIPIELIYPRPDAETAAWTKHRRHHPSTPYFCPVGCAFGSWPFYFEAINLPAGATINSFLTVSGDKLVAGPDYGVVRWATPIVGTYPIHIRVHQQGGGTRVDVHWTLEVTETGTIFIDSVSGNDTTGTGTFALPFKTAEAWWLGDETDITYSEYQVCYLAGTHVIAVDNTTTGITGGNWQLNGTDKPLVHYGAAGQVVDWDQADCTIVVGQVAAVTGGAISGSDMFFGNITQDGGPLLRDDPRQFFFSDFAKGAEVYASGEGGARNTWFNTTHSNFVVTTKSDNNAGVAFCGNPALTYKRHYWYQSQVTFDTISMDAGATNPSNVNLNGFFLSGVINWLAEHGSCIDTDFGKGAYAPKAGARYLCVRNVDYTLAPLQHIAFVLADSYDVNDGGPYEMSYCKSLKTDTDTLDFNLTVNSDFNTYDSGNPNHLPTYLLRNTFSRNPVTGKSSLRIRNSWPAVELGMLYVADDILYLDTDPVPDGTNLITYAIASNPLDVNLDLTGTERTNELGKFGAEVSGTLT